MYNNSTSNYTHLDIPDPYYGKIPWTVAFSLEFVLAIMGNVLIVWIVFRDNRLKTTTNYLITNMAVSDVIAALFVFPDEIVLAHCDRQWLIGGDIGNALCKLNFFTGEMSFAVSAYCCVAIAIDRYFAVAHPFKRPFQGKMKHVNAIIWIVAVVICSPYLYFFNIQQCGNLLYCTVSNKNYISAASLYHYILGGLVSVLPVLFITIAYIFTICKLYHHKVTGLPTPKRRRREKQNKKVLKHAVTIVILLYLCRVSRYTLATLYSEGELNHLSFSSRVNLMHASSVIYCFNCVYNFFIYLIFNDIYSENIKALILKCCSRSGAKRRQQIPDGAAVIEIQELN